MLEEGDHTMDIDSLGFVRFNVSQNFVKGISDYAEGILDLINQRDVKDMSKSILKEDKLKEYLYITNGRLESGKIVLTVEYNPPTDSDDELIIDIDLDDININDLPLSWWQRFR